MGKDANWLRKQVTKLVSEEKYDDAREMVEAYKELPGINVALMRLRINLIENETLYREAGVLL